MFQLRTFVLSIVVFVTIALALGVTLGYTLSSKTVSSVSTQTIVSTQNVVEIVASNPSQTFTITKQTIMQGIFTVYNATGCTQVSEAGIFYNSTTYLVPGNIPTRFCQYLDLTAKGREIAMLSF